MLSCRLNKKRIKNMTIKNKFQILAAAALALGMQSCEDFLDKLPDDRTELDSVEKVQKLLMTAYPTGNYQWLCELSSDNLIDNQTPHLPSSPSKKQVVTYYNYAPYDRWEDEIFRFDAPALATFGDSDSPGQVWENYYSSVAECNYALQTLDELRAQGEPETDFTRALRAEAQIIRAFDHFILVNIFSQAYMGDAENQKNVGVPYVVEPETTMIKEYDRGTVAETYQKIQQDLEAALPYISDSYTNAPKYHFNTQAAHAFAARFYLYTRQYQKALEHANYVLGTDQMSVDKLMMNYERFDDCSYADDFGKVWQDPDQPTNFMLLATYSLLSRRIFGCRYSLAGENCRDVMLYRSSNNYWGSYYIPIQSIVNGALFSSSMHDYGFFHCKINEEFQYTNKLAGIGYPHIIQRVFTAEQLLLERAEAKLMLGDLQGASEDLCTYWNSPLSHFSEKTREQYEKGYNLMTDERMQTAFAQKIETKENDKGLMETKRTNQSGNCYLPEEWEQFLTAVDFPVSLNSQTYIYMNCINEFRRFETYFEGTRFFDLKRWGIEYKHQQGSEGEVFVMKSKDPRRALEVAWESIASGLEPSRPQVGASTTEKSMTKDELRIVNE